MKFLKSSLMVCCLLIFAGCATSKMSVISSEMMYNGQRSVRTIAIPTGAGVLGDAIAVELTNQGYKVFDSQQLSNVLMRANLSEIEIAQPQNLRSLKANGIDAYLSIRSAGGYNRLPESASVRLNSTSDGRVITGVSWQNGWGARQGSICDRVMRKNIADAACEITTGLIRGV